jgi:hypothetical protein
MLVSLVSGRTGESSDRPSRGAGDTVTEETHGTVEICVILDMPCLNSALYYRIAGKVVLSEPILSFIHSLLDVLEKTNNTH